MAYHGKFHHLGLFNWTEESISTSPTGHLCFCRGRCKLFAPAGVFLVSLKLLITRCRFTLGHATGKEHFEHKPTVYQPPRAFTHLQTIAKVEEFSEQM